MVALGRIFLVGYIYVYMCVYIYLYLYLFVFCGGGAIAHFVSCEGFSGLVSAMITDLIVLPFREPQPTSLTGIPFPRIQPRLLSFESKFAYYLFYKQKENYVKIVDCDLGWDMGPPASSVSR